MTRQKKNTRKKGKGLGNTLVMFREQEGLRQEDLAKILSVTPGAVGNYERGRRHPKPLTMRALLQLFMAKGYSFPITDLF